MLNLRKIRNGVGADLYSAQRGALSCTENFGCGFPCVTRERSVLMTRTSGVASTTEGSVATLSRFVRLKKSLLEECTRPQPEKKWTTILRTSAIAATFARAPEAHEFADPEGHCAEASS